MSIQKMQYCYQMHAGQVRHYTGEPYVSHLAEVAGIVATVQSNPISIAVAWGHDLLEGTPATRTDLVIHFGSFIANGIYWLTDRETGNRARERLAAAPGWIQTIKVADILSNTASILHHDPKFASLYLQESRELLDVLTGAHADLRALAMKELGK